MNDMPRDKKGLTEEEFLTEYKKKNYPRPFLTADLVLFDKEKKRVLLVKRKGHPFIGKYALPGGFSKADESIEQTALRELKEETGIDAEALTLVGVYSKPGRDPRGWVVTVAFTASVDINDVVPKAGDDAAEALWFIIDKTGDGIGLTLENDKKIILNETLKPAFDHYDIIRDALNIN